MIKFSSSEQWISRTLRAGVWFSATLLLGGLLLDLIQQSPAERFPGTLTLAQFYKTVFMGSNDHSPGSIVLYAGIMALLLTPVIRVFVAGVTFVAERDWKFVWISIAVFLAFSFELFLSL